MVMSKLGIGQENEKFDNNGRDLIFRLNGTILNVILSSGFSRDVAILKLQNGMRDNLSHIDQFISFGRW